MRVAVGPVSYSLAEDARATVVRVLAYMGGIAILAIAGLTFFRMPATVTAITPAAPPQWIKVERPHPAFELNMPELTATPSEYAILRRPADGARKDLLTWGSVDRDGPFVRVEVFRTGEAHEHFIDAESEIAARLVEFNVADDVKPASQIDSKFGPVVSVDFALASHGKERRCLGFARPFDQPAMQIAGWYCTGSNGAVALGTVNCILDRLTIVSAAGDGILGALFAHAEIKRTFCGQRNPILAATPEREAPVGPGRKLRPGKHTHRLAQRHFKNRQGALRSR